MASERLRIVTPATVDKAMKDAAATPGSEFATQQDAKIAAKVTEVAPAALAAAPAVTAAAAAAVTANIAGRDILESKGIDSSFGLSFAVVDEDGKRTWLEADLAGAPSPYAAGKIAEKVSPGIAAAVETSLGLVAMPLDLAFAVVDEDGRRTDLELGMDGHFTQRVIDYLNGRLNITPPTAAADPTNIIAPSALPLLVGQTYKLYFRDFIDALDANATVTVNTGGYGVTYADRWQYTPTEARTFSLVLNVLDRVGATTTTKTIAVTVYAATSGTGKRHMAIGDSITRAGNYSGLAATALTGATTVGTRTYNNAALNVEGRGGWQLSQYHTQIGHATWGDSPFLFPVGVAGDKFLGNTSFWQKVCYTDAAGYDFQGFQYMARGWKASGAFLFDTNGYPVTPTEDDVVVDPTQAAGATYRKYVSGAWTTMNPQPAIEHSFVKYMARYAAAFPNGGPTSISIMLETNDFYNGIDDTVFGAWKVRADATIAAIRAWSPTVPIIFLLAATGGSMEKWAAAVGKDKLTFDRRMREAARRILLSYDTTDARTNKVYVTTFLGAISIANMADNVHPDTVTGHGEMAPYLAGMLAKLTNEGL